MDVALYEVGSNTRVFKKKDEKAMRWRVRNGHKVTITINSCFLHGDSNAEK